MSEPPFMELVEAGFVLVDEIDDFVDKWHTSSSEEQLHSFLGLTPQEYSLWVSEPDMLHVIIKARHENQSLRDAVNDNLRVGERIAARSDEARKLDVLARWIATQPDR